jgi:hypothetical protein
MVSAKLEIVRDYGKEYSRILAKQELLSHAYIDAFASPGVHILCTTGEMVAGSPVNPTGRLPSRQWRPLAWIAGISGAVLFAPVLLFGNPDKVGGAITAMTMAAVFAIFAAIVTSAPSLVVRYRRAIGVERQQLKWFALAAVLAASYIVGELLGLKRLVGGTFWNLLDAATNTALYVAVGVAVLRYRLYEIDLIFNRALVHGSLTVLLAATFFGGVVGLQAVVRALTGQGATLAVVASTLAIAALFNPLRRRVQALVDRRFYRHKYDAAKTLAAFGSRLREQTDLDVLSNDVVGVVSTTMQPEHVFYGYAPIRSPRTRAAPLDSSGTSRHSPRALFTVVRGRGLLRTSP